MTRINTNTVSSRVVRVPIIHYSLKAFYQLLDSHKVLLTREHIL